MLNEVMCSVYTDTHTRIYIHNFFLMRLIILIKQGFMIILIKQGFMKGLHPKNKVLLMKFDKSSFIVS